MFIQYCVNNFSAIPSFRQNGVSLPLFLCNSNIVQILLFQAVLWTFFHYSLFLKLCKFICFVYQHSPHFPKQLLVFPVTAKNCIAACGSLLLILYHHLPAPSGFPCCSISFSCQRSFTMLSLCIWSNAPINSISNINLNTLFLSYVLSVFFWLFTWMHGETFFLQFLNICACSFICKEIHET